MGTQTEGSVIRPASFPEMSGMKLTYNAISPEGQKTCSHNVDTVNFFAHSIEDLQIHPDTFTLKDDGPFDDISLKEARVAIMKTPIWHLAGPGTVDAMNKAAMILESHGATVEQVSFPSEYDDFDTLKRMYTVVANNDAQAVFLKGYRRDEWKLDPGNP